MNKKKKTTYVYKCQVGLVPRGRQNLVANGPVTLVATLLQMGLDPRQLEVWRKRRGTTDRWVPVPNADMCACMRVVSGSVEKAELDLVFHALAGTKDKVDRWGSRPYWSTRNEFGRGAYLTVEEDRA